MLSPRTILTWQGLRAACDWDIERVKRDVYEGQRADVDVGRPRPVWGAPAWFDRRLGPDGKIRRRNLCMTDLRTTAPPVGDVLFSSYGWYGPWREAWRSWTGPYVLVTAGCDHAVETWAAEELLESGLISHWFAVQVHTTHPKLTPMPLGIDAWMAEAFEAVPVRPWDDRCFKVYLNATEDRGDRPACFDYWRSREDCVIQPFSPQAPKSYANDLGNVQFVVSPPGHGWDCYRTYEAILMGAIPIVLRQPPTSDVVLDLPVMMVDSWDECTPQRLELEAARCRAIRERPHWDASLRLDHWVQKIRRAVRQEVSA